MSSGPASNRIASNRIASNRIDSKIINLERKARKLGVLNRHIFYGFDDFNSDLRHFINTAFYELSSIATRNPCFSEGQFLVEVRELSPAEINEGGFARRYYLRKNCSIEQRIVYSDGEEIAQTTGAHISDILNPRYAGITLKRLIQLAKGEGYFGCSRANWFRYASRVNGDRAF